MRTKPNRVTKNSIVSDGYAVFIIDISALIRMKRKG